MVSLKSVIEQNQQSSLPPCRLHSDQERQTKDNQPNQVNKWYSMLTHTQELSPKEGFRRYDRMEGEGRDLYKR